MKVASRCEWQHRSQPHSAQFIVFNNWDYVSAAYLGQRGGISWESGIELAQPLSHFQERHFERSHYALTLLGMGEWGAMCYR